mgnify:CR=1 FL=1
MIREKTKRQKDNKENERITKQVVSQGNSRECEYVA